MNRSSARRGFTLIELMVVVVIVGIIGAMAVAAFGRQKPRQELEQAALDLRAMMFGARQTALATGNPVVLMVFPALVTGKGTGRLVLYRDGDFSLFSAAAAPKFADYDPEARPAGPRSEVLESVDLESRLVIGPATGQGAAAIMPAPYDGIPINSACAFCTGAGGRGAIAFQPDGSVDFHAGNGPALGALPKGASLSLTRLEPNETVADPRPKNGVRTIVIAAASGSMQTLKLASAP